MARQLARFVGETYGLDVRVTVNPNRAEKSDRDESRVPDFSRPGENGDAEKPGFMKFR
jgi:hypothetical protein